MIINELFEDFYEAPFTVIIGRRHKKSTHKDLHPLILLLSIIIDIFNSVNYQADIKMILESMENGLPGRYRSKLTSSINMKFHLHALHSTFYLFHSNGPSGDSTGDQGGHGPPEIFLAPSLDPHFSKKVFGYF